MRRVLVFQLARFGDLIQTRRLLLSCAAEANTETHLCVDNSLTPLAKALYPFAFVHGLPAHNADGGNPAEVFAGARATLARLAPLSFDAVYFLNYSPLSYACAAMFDPAQLRGYARIKGQNLRSPLAMLAFNLLRDRRFSALNLADLWAFLHQAPVAPEKVNPIPRQTAHGRIGIVMAGRESRRSLPVNVLAKCVQAVFQARGGPALVCLGSRAEAPLVHRLARELPPRSAGLVENLCGKTGLTDLIELVGGLDMVLTPDTGLMHLAASLGVPVQAFFLSSAWCWETGPYGFGHKVWQSMPPCAPCRETDPCPHKSACLQAFTHKDFLAHLAGKHAAQWPDSLLGCITMLDNLGATCRSVDGDDHYSDARKELRNGLGEWRFKTGDDAAPPFMRHELAEFLFKDGDWLFARDWR